MLLWLLLLWLLLAGCCMLAVAGCSWLLPAAMQIG
jgi:hypothetical protein